MKWHFLLLQNAGLAMALLVTKAAHPFSAQENASLIKPIADPITGSSQFAPETDLH